MVDFEISDEHAIAIQGGHAVGQCYNSIVVSAPVEEVWKAIRNFHDFSWSANVVTKVDVVGDKGPTEVGAKRKLSDAFEETLLTLNDDERSFTYSIDNGPGPMSSDAVESYVGTARVFPVTATGQTFVLWTSAYTTKDDDAVGEMCNPIYQGLLNDLAAHFS
jgi:hypothetical protein